MPAESRNSLLAKVHIAKKDLGLPDYVYRDIVFRIGGKFCVNEKTREPSAGLMSDGALMALVAEFRALGWNPGPRPAEKARPAQPKPRRETAPLLSKIEALLLDMGLSWEYAHSIGYRMWQVRRLDWLRPDQLKAVAVALIKKQEKMRETGETAV
jgi:phage gp16-like protein